MHEVRSDYKWETCNKGKQNCREWSQDDVIMMGLVTFESIKSCFFVLLLFLGLDFRVWSSLLVGRLFLFSCFSSFSGGLTLLGTGLRLGGVELSLFPCGTDVGTSQWRRYA